jgi:hypothetical protein
MKIFQRTTFKDRTLSDINAVAVVPTLEKELEG